MQPRFNGCGDGLHEGWRWIERICTWRCLRWKSPGFMAVENDRLRGWNLDFCGAGTLGWTGDICMHFVAGGRKTYYTWSPMRSGWPCRGFVRIGVGVSAHVHVWCAGGRCCRTTSLGNIGWLRVGSRMCIVMVTRFMSGGRMGTHATDVTLTMKWCYHLSAVSVPSVLKLGKCLFMFRAYMVRMWVKCRWVRMKWKAPTCIQLLGCKYFVKSVMLSRVCTWAELHKLKLELELGERWFKYSP